MSQIVNCIFCQDELATRQLPSGRILKKWRDNICENCWIVNDIIQNQQNYPQFTLDMVELLKSLKPNDLDIIAEDCPATPFGDLMYVLYYNDDTCDWESITKNFRAFLDSINLDNLKIANNLHQILVTNHWWE